MVELRRQQRRGPHRLARQLGLAPSTVHAVLAATGCRGLIVWTAAGVPIRLRAARPGELVHVDVKKLGSESPMAADGGAVATRAGAQARRIG